MKDEAHSVAAQLHPLGKKLPTYLFVSMCHYLPLDASVTQDIPKVMIRAACLAFLAHVIISFNLLSAAPPQNLPEAAIQPLDSGKM